MRSARRARAAGLGRARVTVGYIEVALWTYAAATSIIGMTLASYDLRLFAIFAGSGLVGVMGIAMGYAVGNYRVALKPYTASQLAHIGLATGLGFSISVIMQALYLGMAPWMLPGAAAGTPTVLLVAFVTGTAIWEETFNCLFLQLSFERVAGWTAALTIRTAYFAAFHFVAYSSHPAYIAAMAIMGLVVGLAFHLTRSLAVAYGIHTLQNLGAVMPLSLGGAST